ncbi:hypothetical protein [Nocardioides sp.]|nr:hypothetical protein [Nocardioides sp.]HXH78149.1 hypothetical protein [Nocardioides sp.]
MPRPGTTQCPTPPGAPMLRTIIIIAVIVVVVLLVMGLLRGRR